MAEDEQFFRYTDPAKAMQVRLSQLEARVSELEKVIHSIPVTETTLGTGVNSDFQTWVKNEFKAMKARMGRIRLADG